MSLDVEHKPCSRCGRTARGAVLIVDPQMVTIARDKGIGHVKPPTDVLFTDLNTDLKESKAEALCRDCLQELQEWIRSGFLELQLRQRILELEGDLDFLRDSLEQAKQEAEEAITEATKDHVRANW